MFKSAVTHDTFPLEIDILSLPGEKRPKTRALDSVFRRSRVYNYIFDTKELRIANLIERQPI